MTPEPLQPDDHIVFDGPGLEFHQQLDLEDRALLKALAREAYANPQIDGERVHMMRFPQGPGVSIYGRVYLGSRLWIHFDYDDESGVRELTVLNAGFTPTDSSQARSPN